MNLNLHPRLTPALADHTPSLIGYGSTDGSALFAHNTISGTTYGFYLEAEPSYALGATLCPTIRLSGSTACGAINPALRNLQPEEAGFQTAFFHCGRERFC